MSSSASSHGDTVTTVKEISPKVISASRATDIPSWHTGWFMERLREGYCEWQNPFNANQRQLVSFSKTRAIVFWSKNPAPIIPYLDEIADLGKKFYFQFTLNDYEMEGMEPGIPPLDERIETFTHLAQRYNVIWRYDPILIGDRLGVKRHLRVLEILMKRLGDFTTKLVFSFVDIYGRVGSNLKRYNATYRAPTIDEMQDFSLQLLELRDKISPALELATCAEADIDFQAMGIKKNSCIDPGLINKICKDDIFPVQRSLLGNHYAKDKGQRASCGCAPSKDIGSYRTHPCKHGCIYCYAGHARKHLINNAPDFSPIPCP